MPVISDVQYGNFIRTHIKAAVLVGDTSIEVVDASGFPAITGTQYFRLVLFNLTTMVKEIVKVTAVAGNFLTVERAQEGTTAQAYALNDTVEMWVTAALLSDLYAEITAQLDLMAFANTDAGADQSDVAVPNSLAALAAANTFGTIHFSDLGANAGLFEWKTNALTGVSNELRFLGESELKISAGVLAVIGGPIRAGFRRIFDYNGAILSFAPRVDYVRPDWFLTNTASIDMAPAFNDIIEAYDLPARGTIAIGGNTPYNVASVLTLPSHLSLDFTGGGTIRVTTGAALSISGPIVGAENKRIFSLTTGTVAGLKRSRPQWFGDVGDGVADDASEIQSALDSLSGGGVLYFPEGTYLINSGLTIPAGVTMQFDNGAKIEVSGGNTLTVNGTISAEAYEVFSGTGTVDGSPANGRVLPQWFATTVVNDTTSKASPEGIVAAPAGTLHADLNLSAALANIWLKLEGVGNTGWWPLQQLGVTEFADADATPSVKSGKTFQTANTGATTISDFNDGRDGQFIQIHVNDANTIFQFTGANLFGNRGFDYQANLNDTLYAFRISGVWYCTICEAPPAGWDWDSGWTDVAVNSLYSLSDAGGGPGNFSSTSKTSAEGVTGATSTIGAANINPDANDPGFRDYLVMFKPNIGGPYSDYALVTGNRDDDSGGNQGGHNLFISGGDIKVAFPNDRVWNSIYSLTGWANPLDWNPKAVHLTGLYRIKLRI